MFAKFKRIEYYISIPKDIKYISGGYPILFDLHGAGRRGNDVTALTSGALEKFIEGGKKVNAIVIAPQCYAETWFDIFEQLQEFIVAMIEKYIGSEKHIYLSGTSMGGYAAWQLLITMPNTFKRAVICCGGGMYWDAGRIKTPVKAYHGKLDDTVFCEESQKMCDAVNKAGGKAELTVFPDLDHNVWDRVFSDDTILNWLTENN